MGEVGRVSLLDRHDEYKKVREWSFCQYNGLISRGKSSTKGGIETMKNIARKLKVLITVCFIFGLVGCSDKKIELIKMEYKYEYAYIWKDAEGTEHGSSVVHLRSRPGSLEEVEEQTKKWLAAENKTYVSTTWFNEIAN